MKTLKILVLFLLAASFGFSQKADFKASEKYSSTNLRKTVGSTSVRPVWLKDSETFWYSYKTSEGNKWWFVDPAKKSKKPLFDNNYLSGELSKILHKPFNRLDLPIKKLKFEDDNNSFKFEIDSFQFEYVVKTNVISIVDTIKKEDPDPTKRWKTYSPDSTWITFAMNHNIYIMDGDETDSMNYVQLTFDGEKDYSFGRSYGRGDDDKEDTTKRSGARVSWFKDETKFYLTRSDSRKVEELWVINVLTNPRPKLETYKYAMPGDEFVPQTELWIFNAEKKEGKLIDLCKWKDQTLSPQKIGDRSDKMLVTRKKRTCDELEILKVDTETGEYEVYLHEISKPYFHSSTRLNVLEDGKYNIWYSERTGWAQLYLYDSEGNMKNQITDGNFVVGGISKIDTAKQVLYFSGYGREEGIDPYYNMYYKVNFDGTGMQLLTPEDANHSFSMPEKSFGYFTDTYSRVDMVPKSVLKDNKGNLVMELETTDISELLKTGWKFPERFKVKANDGITDLYGVMWTPINMEKDRKYPIISYVYPGPQTESVTRTFSPTSSHFSMAQIGFVTINVGHRGGSPQRHKYYHEFGYNNLRDYALADDKYAIEQLADKYCFIDINKVGIHGHSGGGFMSTAAILSYPDFYTCAVSSAGNHDNNVYNLWWGETHHGVKEVEKKERKKKKKEGDEDVIKDEDKDEKDVEKDEDKDEKDVKKDKDDKGTTKIDFVSKIPKNQDLAKNLKGHLFIIHGDIDNNVHPANSIRMVDALMSAGKKFDFMIMPGQRHGFGKYNNYKTKLMYDYFAEHLLGDYRTNVEIDEYYK
ncbi:DPP IV N-terminal domain-containing protein [Bacteroidota bacterium]